MSGPQYAVIIPHYNDAARLEKCLAALMPQIDCAGEVVVADNNSTMELSALKDAFPGARFVVAPIQGAAAARNKGVEETTAPLLFFIDADCVPDPDWIAVARSVASDADLVGGRVSTFDETPAPKSGAEAFETVFAFNQRSYVEDKGFSVTANLLTRRDVFDAVGGFVPGVSEDVDWCHRARDRGFGIVYRDQLAVGHPTRQDMAALLKKWRRLTQEMGALNGRGLKDRLRWLFRAVLVAGAGIAYLPRTLASPHLTGLERRRAALTLLRLYTTRSLWMIRQALGGSI